MPNELTDRQREVVTLLAEGLSAQEIAERLGVGAGTVEQHRYMAYQRLGISSIVDLVKLALARGWVRNPYARGRPRKQQ
jgi:DNA-binding CsgD family transcriptional regulator